MKRALSAVALLIFALAGCGGGGGSSSTSAGNPSGGYPTNYSTKELTPLQGYTNNAACHIDNNGRIVGGSWKDGGYSTNVWETSGSVRSVSTLDMETTDMNEAGQVIGYTIQPSVSYVKLDISSGSVTNLYDFSAYSINDSGDMAGSSAGSPAVLSAGGTKKILSIPESYTGGAARRINNSGIVVGDVTGSQSSRAIIWNQDGSIKVQFPIVTGFTYSRAVLINDAGQSVICYSSAKDYIYEQAVLRGADGSTLTLNNFGYSSIGVEDINGRGQVVGNVSNTGDLADGNAAVWNPDDTAHLLPAPTGYTRANAFGINDSGVIVGRAIDATGIWHAVAWTLGS